MTKLGYSAGLLIAAIGLGLPNVAVAQYSPNQVGAVVNSQIGTGGYGGNVSPYLNLTNPFNSQIPTYQTLVQPFMQTQNSLQQQGSAVQGLQRQARSSYAGSGGTRRTLGGGGGAALSTGHTTSFMNYSHYYARGRR